MFMTKKQRSSTESFVKAIFDRPITGCWYKKSTSELKYLVGLYRLVLTRWNRVMESLIQKLSLVPASDSELWKDLLMSGTRTLDPHKGPLIWGLYGENIGR